MTEASIVFTPNIPTALLLYHRRPPALHPPEQQETSNKAPRPAGVTGGLRSTWEGVGTQCCKAGAGAIHMEHLHQGWVFMYPALLALDVLIARHV